MPLRRMKRSSVSGPPCGGGGAARTSWGRSTGGGARTGSICPHGMRAAGLQRRVACHHARPMADDPTLAERLLRGDKRALARAITLVEDDRPEGWELVREVYPHTGRAAVVGFTGPPGVGKSTLLGALTKAERAKGRTVGVLSIDLSSPFTQGALLVARI